MAFGHSSRIWDTLRPSPLPSWVMNGAIVLPEKSYSDRKVMTGVATVPHQQGEPTTTTSYAPNPSIFVFSGGLNPVSSSRRACSVVAR